MRLRRLGTARTCHGVQGCAVCWFSTERQGRVRRVRRVGGGGCTGGVQRGGGRGTHDSACRSPSIPTRAGTGSVCRPPTEPRFMRIISAAVWVLPSSHLRKNRRIFRWIRWTCCTPRLASCCRTHAHSPRVTTMIVHVKHREGLRSPRAQTTKRHTHTHTARYTDCVCVV